MSQENLEQDDMPDRAAAETADEAAESEMRPDTEGNAEAAENPENPDGPDDDEVETLQARVVELNEKILRMAAENQNTRKRLVKQQQDAHKYRHQDILRDLADVIDNFERAIESSAESKDFDTFHEGIMMIEKQFSGMLNERYGLEKIGAVGEVFDPASHEAMMMEESADFEVETVTQVYQAGYRLHERVLRPAKVVVSKPAAPVTENEDADDSEAVGNE